ncbi:B3 domain-containing protein Os01g0234100-like isoform X1 [Papaver somniferum]|uniref:B3 domain-containing protein Os01g0234100-like isoform X1 n=1 Tax=Papaver somniferum TaxID=3469 RepID=UPI000E7047EB|nr:B3 domain-containing protein Os01g0234100-like isoform X1 [Papaver somniferum]
MKSSSAMVTTQSLPKVIASGKKNDVRLMTEVEKPKSLVEVRAEEIQFGLDPQFPSLVKLMLRSHVVQGFWLGLTSKFCSRLPKNDTEVTLVGEDGEEYTANYLSHKFGLSGGWRGFATAHKLVEGDALVFQLVEAAKFKVYIVRAHSLANVEVASSLLKSGIPAKGGDQADAEERKTGIKYTRKHILCRPAVPLIGEDQHTVPPLKSCKEMKMNKSPAQKHVKSHLSVPFLGDDQDATLPIAGPKETTATDDPIRKRVKFHPSVLHLGGDQNVTLPLSSSKQPEDQSNRKVIDTEVLEGTKLSDSSVEIQDVTDFESFTITVNGLIIDPKMSENYRSKYYELCRSQKTYLHKNLMQGVNSKLVAGIICETVDIADAIRASELGTPKDDFKAWRKSLIGFKHLGMNADVLLSRIDILLKLVMDTEDSFDKNETMVRRNRVKREIAALDMKILELRNESVRLEREVKALQVNEEKHEAFYSVVRSPW